MVVSVALDLSDMKGGSEEEAKGKGHDEEPEGSNEDSRVVAKEAGVSHGGCLA